MSVRVAINGFGRVGRCALRSAIETDAAPPFVIEDSHAPRDIFAIVREAPHGGAIQLLPAPVGTTFRVRLPVEGALSAEAAADAHDPADAQTHAP